MNQRLLQLKQSMGLLDKGEFDRASQFLQQFEEERAKMTGGILKKKGEPPQVNDSTTRGGQSGKPR